jgi:hypothetical protein
MRHAAPISAARLIPAVAEDIQAPQGPLWAIILVGVMCDKGKADCRMTE